MIQPTREFVILYKECGQVGGIGNAWQRARKRVVVYDEVLESAHVFEKRGNGSLETVVLNAERRQMLHGAV